jgi:glycosyltransferase involved in cell wall biosynthesis
MGTADVLAGMHGATVAPENEAEFARLAAEILRSPEQRSKLSPLAEADAQAWSSRRFAERLIGLYEGLAAAPSPERVAA